MCYSAIGEHRFGRAAHVLFLLAIGLGCSGSTPGVKSESKTSSDSSNETLKEPQLKADVKIVSTQPVREQRNPEPEARAVLDERLRSWQQGLPTVGMYHLPVNLRSYSIGESLGEVAETKPPIFRFRVFLDLGSGVPGAGGNTVADTYYVRRVNRAWTVVNERIYREAKALLDKKAKVVVSTLYAIGGSDGKTNFGSMEALSLDAGLAFKKEAR